MATNSEILSLNTSQGESGAWEAFVANNALGSGIEWQAAAVRTGGTDARELYFADSQGNIWQFETGEEDDEGEPIPFLFTSKKYDLQSVAMVHSVFFRFDPVDDELTCTVRTGGSEYGELSRSYTVDLSDANGEAKVRVHRTMFGRWCQIELSGLVSHRPEIRETDVRFVPWRSGRVST